MLRLGQNILAWIIFTYKAVDFVDNLVRKYWIELDFNLAAVSGPLPHLSMVSQTMKNLLIKNAHQLVRAWQESMMVMTCNSFSDTPLFPYNAHIFEK